MTYYITFKVEGRYVAPVEADSLEQAKKLGEQEMWVANLNEMDFVETELVMVEDEKGDYLYEK